MILRTTTGRSFKGVGKYVLHDKGAQSDERVSFIETENLVFNDGDRAIAEMVRTAMNQKALRRRNGDRATATSKPVYHYSLSWDTSETPSLKEQMQAARESLKSLGLDDRQAMIVGHTDTDNPHVHVVVNLVHPTTGATAKLGNDWLKLSNWAEAYRLERGQAHLCPQRKRNNGRRRDGEFVKADNMTRQEYEAWKKSQTKDIWDSFRADRANARASRKGQYEALWAQKENRVAQRKDEISALFKPRWRDLYKRQRTELKDFDAGFFDRLSFALRRRHRSKIMGFIQALTFDRQLRKEFIDNQAREKKQLGQEHKSRVMDASREARKAWQYDRDQLKASHEAEDQRAHAEAKAKSSAIWKAKDDLSKSGQDFTDTADRRKDHKTRRKFDDKIRANRSDDEIQKARSSARKERRRRPRKRDRGITPD
jgi:hypothetical protein